MTGLQTWTHVTSKHSKTLRLLKARGTARHAAAQVLNCSAGGLHVKASCQDHSEAARSNDVIEDGDQHFRMHCPNVALDRNMKAA